MSMSDAAFFAPLDAMHRAQDAEDWAAEDLVEAFDRGEWTPDENCEVEAVYNLKTELYEPYVNPCSDCVTNHLKDLEEASAEAVAEAMMEDMYY